MPKLAPETQAARRDHILDAAASCFEQAGFHGTSMHDICAAAEVSPGALYTYFASKEELIAGLVEREKERFSRELAHVADSPDLIAAIHGLAQHFCCDQSPGKLRLHVEIGAEASRNEALGRIVRQTDKFVMESFAELLSQAKEKGLIDPVFDVQTVVRAMAAIGDGLFWHRAVDPDFDPRPILPAVMVMASALIRPLTPDGAEAPFNLEDVAS